MWYVLLFSITCKYINYLKCIPLTNKENFNLQFTISYQDGQKSYGFDRSAVEGEPNKRLLQNPENSDANLSKNTVVTYNLPGSEEHESSEKHTITSFNRESVERTPQTFYAYSGDYYGAASNIGRNLENGYFGNMVMCNMPKRQVLVCD